MTEDSTRIPQVDFGYPRRREPIISCFSTEASAVMESWNRSRSTLNSVNRLLVSSSLDERIRCVAVSGSLGRMEQVAASDIDLVIILNDAVQTDSAVERSRLHASVWDALSSLEMSRPKSDGIFAHPVTVAELCRENHRGIIDGPMHLFGLRIQLLLDSQPVYGESEFLPALHRILDFYAVDDASFEFLSNELVRYYRSMSLHCHWNFRDHPGVWRMRNLKLRFSRRLIYAALLVLLIESRRTQSRTTPGKRSSWILKFLELTPLERLCHFGRAGFSHGRESLVRCYGAFLSAFSDENWRDELFRAREDVWEPWFNNNYQDLLSTADRFGELICDILLSYAHDRWSRKALAEMIM